MAETVFLDANVLFARVPRLLALAAGEAGLCRPVWSPRVLEEWRRAALTRGGLEAGAEAAAAIAALPPAGLVPDAAGAPLLHLLPDPADAHVIAAAAAAGADTLLTFNLRDFPARLLAGEGLALRHPDGFFWELWSGDAGVLAPALALATGADDPADQRRLLKRAGLPRLGKAVAGV